jgi:nitrite reductase (NADH) small subunit
MDKMPSATRSLLVNLGSVEKIPKGQGFCFIVEGEEIAVFRQRDGKFFATQNRCPHKNGPLSDGLIGAGQVICPLHSKKFDLATGRGPEPQHCLKTYSVQEANGEVHLTWATDQAGSTCTPAA